MDQVDQAARRQDGKTARPGSIPGGGEIEILLSFVSRLVLESAQPPIKLVPGAFPGDKGGRA